MTSTYNWMQRRTQKYNIVKVEWKMLSCLVQHEFDLKIEQDLLGASA